MGRKLTKKQQLEAFHQAVWNEIQDTQVTSRTVRQWIGKCMGVVSPSSWDNILVSLHEQGYVEWEKGDGGNAGRVTFRAEPSQQAELIV